MSPLFAAIGLSIGLGSRLLRTDDGEDDHGGHIGDHLEELVRDGDAGDLKPDLQRIAEAEEQAGQQDAAGTPAAKDHGSQGDEAAAGHDTVSVGAGIAGGQVRAAQSGQRTADHAGQILYADDIDAQRSGRLRMLSHRFIAQSRTGTVKENGGEHHQQQRQIDHGTLIKQQWPDDRDVLQAGNSNAGHGNDLLQV